MNGNIFSFINKSKYRKQDIGSKKYNEEERVRGNFSRGYGSHKRVL